jgi:hypothetical protein
MGSDMYLNKWFVSIAHHISSAADTKPGNFAPGSVGGFGDIIPVVIEQ